MKSLLLKGKIVTLEEIKKELFNLSKIEKHGDLKIIPNGENNYTINKEFVSGDYIDSVILKERNNEYPMYFGGNSFGANPTYLVYGKKVRNRMILLQDIFINRDLYSDNPDLGSCRFIVAKIRRKELLNKSERLLYNMFEDEEESDLDIIGYDNLKALKESVSKYNKLFALIKTKK